VNEEELREHVRMCPIGWSDGDLRMTRKTTAQDVIEWVWKLRELVGLNTSDGDSPR
jgi:hypothetical protein